MHSISEARRQPGGEGRRAGLAAILILALGAPQAGARPAAEETCGGRVAREDRLAGVAPSGELRLASGRTARLDGVRLPADPSLAAAARAWLDARKGQRLATREDPAPDRWERVALDAVAEEPGGDPVDLAGGLLAAGLALVDAGESDRLCRPGLLAVEAAARQARRGLWAGDLPLRAEDAAVLAARVGQFVVAEGRVRSVGERRSRTYLNFAPFGEEGLTVTVTKRTWRTLLERGLTAAALRGRRARARGVVELWRGPTLDIGAAEMIEMLDEERAQRR
ncbi:hypothetical protein [Methylobacterium sp. WSM2598]|uniref:hypothetical protein n=1 Tax=Methylobacterium sp. WSM2598 TaxID=398261 RepID=UPI0003678779|nr:hypothetical protein [Methylobacterium sp. WSM2598]